MALSQRLNLRQTQAPVMTPQLQQAIKLLQLSNLELADFVESELEQNPLLEREDPSGDHDAPAGEGDNSTETGDPENDGGDFVDAPEPPDVSELTQRESELLVHDVKQLHIVQHNWTQFSSHESSISGAG